LIELLWLVTDGGWGRTSRFVIVVTVPTLPFSIGLLMLVSNLNLYEAIAASSGAGGLVALFAIAREWWKKARGARGGGPGGQGDGQGGEPPSGESGA
jgi:hypothetical protein